MSRKRLLVLALCIGALASNLGLSRAQEDPPAPPPTPPPAEPTSPPASPTPAETKPGFWGDRFALYIQAGGGTGTAETLDSSIKTSTRQTTLNVLDMDMLVADVAIGWQLPQDRGSFRLEFTGFSEDSSEFQGSGNLGAVSGASPELDFNPTWWNVRVADGSLRTTLTPPTWTDANSDGVVQPNEIVYAATPDAVLTAATAENFQNRLQTYDFLFLRDFGGRAWSARYTCGLRYLIYEGNVPATAWLSAATSVSSYTDGVIVPLLYLFQETSGFGPTGSLELHYNLFRRRLTLFGQARFAFLLQDTEVDSGPFVTFIDNSGTVLTANGRIQDDSSRAVWNLGGKLGARFRIVDGFTAELFFERAVYHDVVSLPYEIQVPASQQQMSRGTSALFNTQNMEIDSVRLILGFQF